MVATERKLLRKKLDREMRFYRLAGRQQNPTSGLLRAVRQALKVPLKEVAGRLGGWRVECVRAGGTGGNGVDYAAVAGAGGGGDGMQGGVRNSSGEREDAGRDGTKERLWRACWAAVPAELAKKRRERRDNGGDWEDAAKRENVEGAEQQRKRERQSVRKR